MTMATTAYTTLGLGDVYMRRQDEAEAHQCATRCACSRCGKDNYCACLWYEYRGRLYCEDCYLVMIHPVPCSECGATEDVDDEIGLCRPCEFLWPYQWSEEARR